MELCSNLMEGGTTPSVGNDAQTLSTLVSLDKLLFVFPHGWKYYDLFHFARLGYSANGGILFSLAPTF